jgi:hypothetical protein
MTLQRRFGHLLHWFYCVPFFFPYLSDMVGVWGMEVWTVGGVPAALYFPIKQTGRPGEHEKIKASLKGKQTYWVPFNLVFYLYLGDARCAGCVAIGYSLCSGNANGSHLHLRIPSRRHCGTSILCSSYQY